MRPGEPHTQEAKDQISASLKAYWADKEHVRKGTTCSQETRKRMSEKAKQRYASPAARAATGEAVRRYYAGHDHPNKGKPMPEEIRAKISAAQKGKTVSAETRAAMSRGQKRRFATQPHPMLGKTTSEETKQKQRIGALKREIAKTQKAYDEAREKARGPECRRCGCP